MDPRPTRSALAALLAATTACSLIQKPSSGGGDASQPAGAGLDRAGTDDAPASGGATPAAPAAAEMPVVSAEAAHPSIAWFIARTGEVPGFSYGGTGHAEVPADVVARFVLDRAVVDIAPACLRDYGMPKTAGKLEKLGPVDDAAAIDAAGAAIDGIAASSAAELAGKDYSDKANGEDAAQMLTEALRPLADATRRVAAGRGTIGVDALRGWVQVLDVCFDATQPALIEKNLGQYVALLKKGKPPARSSKATPRRVHPGIATFIRLLGESIPVGELSELLAIDVGDTLRGANVDIALFASDIAVRELAPKVLTGCKALAEATTVSKIPPIKSGAALDKALDVLATMDGYDGPNHLCIGMMQNLVGSVVGEANEARSAVKQDINSHPYYARGVFSGWKSFVTSFPELHVPPAEIADLTRDLLRRAVTKLRSMPKRKETSREPE